MKLSPLTWIISGGIISVTSAYIYWFNPGTKNPAMGLFLFIGGIFIIVGIIKFFFRKVNDGKSVIDSIEKSQEPKIVPFNESEIAPTNRVEEQIAEMVKKEEVQKISQQNTAHSPQTHHHAHQTHAGHSNTYARTHEYKGPVHESQKSTLASHVQTQTPNKVVNTQTHSVRCRRCGNVNFGTANFCHSCGNRLK